MVRIRTNFEKLEIYQLSEELSDKVWAIVKTWDWFAKDTLGKQLVKAADSVGAILLRAVDAVVELIISASSELPEVRYMKRSIGCAVRIGENY